MYFSLGKQANALPAYLTTQVQLYNRLWNLMDNDVDEGPSRLEWLPRTSQTIPSIVTTSTKKKRRVAVIDDSLLRGTEGTIDQLIPTCS